MHHPIRILTLLLSLTAADVFSADTTISDATPDLFFDDTDFGPVDWTVSARANSANFGDLSILSSFNGTTRTPLKIISGNNFDNTDSLVIESNNIVRLTKGQFNFFNNPVESTTVFQMGSGTVETTLAAYGTSFSINVVETPGLIRGGAFGWADNEWKMGFNDPVLVQQTHSFRLHGDAPEDSLVVAADGQVSSVASFSAPIVGAVDTVAPEMILLETSTSATNFFLLQGNAYGQGPLGNFPIFAYDITAPPHSLSIRADGNVGFGTDDPFQAVEVARDGAARFAVTSYTSTPSESAQYIMRRARGTESTPTAVQNGDNLGLFSFRGYNGSVMGGSRATITAQAAGNFTNSSTPTRLIFAVAPNGSTTPEQVMVIENGQVKVNGQNLNVPDYVFEDDYPLMPLNELQSFIDANGHLPGIPSAQQVNAEGHDLAGSDMAHLRKIEELTLYTLQQQTLIESQQATIQRLTEQLDGVVARLEIMATDH